MQISGETTNIYEKTTATYVSKIDYHDVDKVEIYIGGGGIVVKDNVVLGENQVNIDALKPGKYKWQVVTHYKDGRVAVYDEGILNVVTSFLGSGGREIHLTFAEQCLQHVEQVLLDQSQIADISFSVGSQSFNFENRSSLMDFRTRLQVEIEREKHPEKFKSGIKVVL